MAGRLAGGDGAACRLHGLTPVPDRELLDCNRHRARWIRPFQREGLAALGDRTGPAARSWAEDRDAEWPARIAAIAIPYRAVDLHRIRRYLGWPRQAAETHLSGGSAGGRYWRAGPG